MLHAMRLTVRPFQDTDAPQLAEWLHSLAPADDVYTAASLVHQRRMHPGRRRPLWLVPRMEPALRRLFLAADQAPVRSATPRPVSAGTFRRVILQNPLLDMQSSTVVLHGSEPVALCWLKGDRALGRYGVEFTGTAPDWRGQGLAMLAKLSALHLAARAGVRWIGTANDETNAPMLAVNRRLGHQSLPDLLVYERDRLD
jgi:GNAT superfamily N-acetyltransferase